MKVANHWMESAGPLFQMAQAMRRELHNVERLAAGAISSFQEAKIGAENAGTRLQSEMVGLTRHLVEVFRHGKLLSSA